MSPSRLNTGPFHRRLASGVPWWPMALVFVPLLLLAALGIRGLQMSRLAAREGAEREVERAVRQVSQALMSAMGEVQNIPMPRLYPVPPLPAPPTEAQALYQQALHAEPSAALHLLKEIADRYPDALTESGLPLLPLVEWKRLQIEDGPAKKEARVSALARAAVETHPSVITPELLTRAETLFREEGLPTSTLELWRPRWNVDENLRRVFRENASFLASANASAWIQTDDEFWWAERSGESSEWRLIPRARLVGISDAAVAQVGAALPEYASLQVSFHGKPLLETVSGERLAQLEQGGFVITGLLRDPAKLFAQQRQQRLWLAALLGCAVLAACGGTWMMNAALARERQLNALKSDFVSSISHELRAPVASMRIMAENLRSGIVSDESRRHEYHQLIAEECWRLGTLIENVLDLARIERNRKTYRFAECDIAALVSDAVQLMRPRAAQRRQDIQIQLPEVFETPPFCDSLAVQQALINLLDNAIKFSPELTTVTVVLAVHCADRWELSVLDQGPGVPEAEQGNIFERFYRLGSELRRETQGAGIGLSIVKHIAEGHGGSVTVENQPDGGARFTLALPLVPPGVDLESGVPCLAS